MHVEMSRSYYTVGDMTQHNIILWQAFDVPSKSIHNRYREDLLVARIRLVNRFSVQFRRILISYYYIRDDNTPVVFRAWYNYCQTSLLNLNDHRQPLPPHTIYYYYLDIYSR